MQFGLDGVALLELVEEEEGVGGGAVCTMREKNITLALMVRVAAMPNVFEGGGW